MEKEKKYLKPWQYFTFGGGNAGMVLSNNFITAFIILFISSYYLNLNTAVIGTLMLVGKIFDGVSDIIFGNIMDRSHSRLGKARPWMLRGAVPLGVCGILMFCLPDSGGWVPYAFFFLFYVLYNAVFYTMVNLAYNAMTALITRSNTERVTINVASYVIVMVSNILVNATTLGIVGALGNTATAWRITMGGFTVIGTVLILLSALLVKELPMEGTDVGQDEKKADGMAFKDSICLALKNPYYIWAILFNLINSLVLVGSTGLLLYFCDINLGDINIYSSLSAIYMLVTIPPLFIAPALTAKFTTYKLNLACSVLMTAMTVLVIPAGMSGNFLLFSVIFCLRFVPLGVLLASTAPIVPSIVEYSYKQTGKRIEGIIFSSVSIGYKIASGIGAALPGWILAAIKYNATAETQSASTVQGMAFWFYALPIIIGVLSIIVFKHMDVERGIRELDQK